MPPGGGPPVNSYLGGVVGIQNRGVAPPPAPVLEECHEGENPNTSAPRGGGTDKAPKDKVPLWAQTNEPQRPPPPPHAFA